MPLFLIAPTLFMMPIVPAQERPGGCFERVPTAIPAPNSEFDGRHQTIAIHQQPTFLFRVGTSAHLRLIESPVDRDDEPKTFDLFSTDEMLIAEGVRFERYGIAELPLGHCFALHERPDSDSPYFRSAIYGSNTLCVTKRGAPALAEPDTPELAVSARPPTFGTPGSGLDNDRILAEPACSDPMTTGSGNIAVVISGLTATPSAILVELLEDDAVAQSRELLIHDRMLETQRPLIVRFRSNSVSNQQIRATHRLLGGATGEPVVVDVVMPSSCQHLPGESLLLLLGLVGLRLRRQLG